MFYDVGVSHTNVEVAQSPRRISQRSLRDNNAEWGTGDSEGRTNNSTFQALSILNPYFQLRTINTNVPCLM